jgi:hypothetical protein
MAQSPLASRHLPECWAKANSSGGEFNPQIITTLRAWVEKVR